MSLYSISGVGCCGDAFGQLSVINGRAKRKARRAARVERRTARKAKRRERKTRLYCKGAFSKRIALSVPRKAFLTLVRLNVKKIAVKLYNALQDPIKKKKLSAKWCKLGGNFKVLERNILKAYEKFKRKRTRKGKTVSGIGDPLVLTIISTATPILLALAEFLKTGKATEPEATETEETETEETTTEGEGETVEGIGAVNPLLLAGIVGAGVYYLTKKGKI